MLSTLYSTQDRAEVGWRPVQEASLAPMFEPKVFQEQYSVFKKVLSKLLWLVGSPQWFGARGNVTPFLHLATPLASRAYVCRQSRRWS